MFDRVSPPPPIPHLVMMTKVLRKGAEGPSMRVGAQLLMHKHAYKTTEPGGYIYIHTFCFVVFWSPLHSCIPVFITSWPPSPTSLVSTHTLPTFALTRTPNTTLLYLPTYPATTPTSHQQSTPLQVALWCLTFAPSCSSGSSTWTSQPQPPSSRHTCLAAPHWWTWMLTERWRLLWAQAWALCMCWTTR